MAYRSEAQRETVLAIVQMLADIAESRGTTHVSEETLDMAFDAYLFLAKPASKPGRSFESNDYDLPRLGVDENGEDVD